MPRKYFDMFVLSFQYTFFVFVCVVGATSVFDKMTSDSKGTTWAPTTILYRLNNKNQRKDVEQDQDTTAFSQKKPTFFQYMYTFSDTLLKFKNGCCVFISLQLFKKQKKYNGKELIFSWWYFVLASCLLSWNKARKKIGTFHVICLCVLFRPKFISYPVRFCLCFPVEGRERANFFKEILLASISFASCQKLWVEHNSLNTNREKEKMGNFFWHVVYLFKNINSKSWKRKRTTTTKRSQLKQTNNFRCLLGECSWKDKYTHMGCWAKRKSKRKTSRSLHIT